MKLQTIIHRKNILFFTVGLALLTMMGILGVDTYLPSIPDIAKEFEKKCLNHAVVDYGLYPLHRFWTANFWPII